MILQKILTIIMLPSVLPFHFYNPRTHSIISHPSLKNIPAGYRLLSAPKTNTRNRGRNGGKMNRICTDAGFTCSSPYQKSQTFQFECDHDYQCPSYYKCCPQKCFLHKICSRSDVAVPTNWTDTYERPGTCEKWPYNCQTPYSNTLTSMFKCYSDRQCPRGFKCCEQSCFSHRICSRAIGAKINGLVRPLPQVLRGIDSTKTVFTKLPSTSVNLIVDKNFPEEVPSTTAPQLIVDYEVDPNRCAEGTSCTESPTTEDIVTDDDRIIFIEDFSSTDTTETDSETEVTTLIQDEYTDERKEGIESEESSVEVTYEDTLGSTEETSTLSTNFQESSSGEETTTGVNTISDIDELLKIQSNTKTVINASTNPSISDNTTPDSNAIIPEYSAYYYHYGEGNDTEYDDEDYDDEEE